MATERKEFKAESKRLLDLMINSIYTHKEIFLRELISNASDAMDKLYYRALSENITGLNREDFVIALEIDKENRTLTISDNGCGMTKEELEEHLGTIAQSGSFQFKKDNAGKENTEEIDVIGQFGVGFYSAFMVSSLVTVRSRAYHCEQGYVWESTGADGYTIAECDKAEHGTEIVLKIKDNTEEDNYDEFLEEYRLRSIVKKYSDYIRYPIKMDVEKSRPKAGTEGDKVEYETYTENETLNSMVPLWKKNRNEVTAEEYNNFYKEKFYDFQDPLKVIYTSTEGAATYNALLFIPEKTYNYYTKEFEKGLQLYASGVLIMDKCPDLLPDHFSFVKGLVDSQDLQLNISREMLQHDKQLKLIASRLEKKIQSELLSMLKNDREKYEKFYANFGLQLKYGIYADYGLHKDQLKDLILFYSSAQKKLVSLAEYVTAMKEDQKYIYYACGASNERLDLLPQTEVLKDKGFEILYLTEDIDEFALRVMDEYEGKKFKSVSDSDLGIEENEEDKASAEKQKEDNKELLDFMKEALEGKVNEVCLSNRLKSHPVCLSTKGAISLEMEKVLNSMPDMGDNKVKAERVLEINSNHPIFAALVRLFATDKETVKTYARLLYTQAQLIDGLTIEDPVAFSNDICDLMSK